MSLTLYGMPFSPPMRGTLLTIHALGLEGKLKIVPVNTMKNDHLKPEFVEKNPVHTIPTLEDGDFILWDSHAISGYLVNKYAKNDDLYPKDPKKRALVDAMNHFDTGYLFPRGVNYMRAFGTPDNQQEAEKLKVRILESLDMLEAILEKHTYAAGEQVTIADFGIVAIVSTLVTFKAITLETDKHLKIIAWLQRMEALPYYHVNAEALKQMQQAFAERT